MKLKDKVAIITGGGGGLGRVFSLAMTQEGAKVVIAEIDWDKAQAVRDEVQGKGGEVVALKTDVSKEKDTLEMAQKTIERFGRIDILVNNAGIFPMKPWDQITGEEWDHVLATNLKGCFLCAKAVFPHMKKQGKGKIINISSGVYLMGFPNFIHYVSSKAGIIGFTRALAREVGDYGINVNAVTLGLTQTEAVKKLIPEEAAEQLASTQCLKRKEMPEDLAGTILFLASEDSDFITGQIINVDGGWAMH